jgi:hypothetical protein
MARKMLAWAALAGAVLFQSAAAQPIRLHPKNPHYFLFRGNAVALVSSGEHYGCVINGAIDYERYLASLAADGMNYTRIFGGTYVEVPAQSFGIHRNNLAPGPGQFVAPWARSETPGYAGGGNQFDLDRWNPEYFARLHDFLAEASRLGIVVEVTLFSSHYIEAHWSLSPFNPANNVNATSGIDWRKLHMLDNGNILARQEQYTRKLVREANGFDNVIFEIQNEPWSDRTVLAGVVNPYLPAPDRDRYPNSIDLADEASMKWQAQVAKWIATEEAALPNKHLIAQNYCNFGFPVGAAAPGVSIINFHYAYPAAATLNYGMGLALSCDETGFRGHADEAYRREAWSFMLAGGSVFDNLDYSFTAGHEDGSDAEANGPGGGSPALRHQLRVLSEFLRSLPLADLAPDQGVVKLAAGAYAYALSASGRRYAMYFDGSGPVAVTLDLPAGAYSGEWINIQTGAVERAEKFPHRGGAVTLQTPGFADGIALRLDRMAR